MATESPYLGQELDIGEIRLLTISSTESGLAISTEPHMVTEDLLFDAVSYVWGTAPATVETTCNGKPFLVTSTAYEMLVHLHRFRPSPQRPLWIDAICINQDDADEKAIQVPFMRRIFSRAVQVIIWMGPSTPDTEVFMAEFPRVLKLAKDWIPTLTEPYVLWETNRWPQDDNPFWSGCFHLVSREWFRRLWTFQEAVLARKAIVLSGASWIDLDIFVDFVVSGHYGKIPYFPPNSPQVDRLTWDNIDSISNYRKWIINQGVSVLAINIPYLLQNMRYRHVKEAVDRVWAVAGLFEEDVQKELAPKVDYSVQARKDYFKTFIDLAKVVLSRSGELDLLSVGLLVADS
ncbi:hypothetical protein SLS58_009707 [Diplodia intermedia]|uniref:Heterokaryon incompatibility domain-containing protein n=1 Tax=Diplodia intermedia TaxID=856260 RepID=A0ABR3TAR5_9PEZI